MGWLYVVLGGVVLCVVVVLLLVVGVGEDGWVECCDGCGVGCVVVGCDVFVVVVVVVFVCVGSGVDCVC